MRRLWMTALLAGVATSALAHDDQYGLTDCYGGRHCRQDMLVFGLVTQTTPLSFCVLVTRALRGWPAEGRTIWLRHAHQMEYCDHRYPKAGWTVLASYLARDPEPRPVRHLVHMVGSDWRTATLDGSGPIRREIEAFVHTGGAPSEVVIAQGKAFEKRPNGLLTPLFDGSRMMPPEELFGEHARNLMRRAAWCAGLSLIGLWAAALGLTHLRRAHAGLTCSRPAAAHTPPDSR
ncbi:MAG: hypothetical protein HZB16_22580 [Armatimonadetes bacterium]|nr:hypothetical protein [Armatimonadota bacterium]